MKLSVLNRIAWRGMRVVIAIGLITAVLATFSLVYANISIGLQRSHNQSTMLYKNTFTLPENTSNVPADLDSNTLIDVIAKNQPAVVRVLTVYCSDIELRSGDASFTVTDACTGGVGSGSLISSDGYIATNGHVVTVSLKQALESGLSDSETVTRFLQYIVDSTSLSPRNARLIADAVGSGSEDGYAALLTLLSRIDPNTIKAIDAEYQYVIQLSNEPVRVSEKDNRIVADINDTVVSAKLIDKDFDDTTVETSLQTGQFSSSDVAVLKIEGESYPYVTLGSIKDVNVNDQLTAIGFPAFIDNSINTANWQTVPSITQGSIDDSISDADSGGREILLTSVPIAQGNSGGPAFNDAGMQIGINTYSDIECADLQCFGDGVIRDAADLTALIDKNNITLKNEGVTSDWHQALDAYRAGEYQKALTLFQKVQTQYPANYLVSPLLLETRKRVGTSTDISSLLQLRATIAMAAVGTELALGTLFVIYYLTCVITGYRINRRTSA